MNFLDITGFGNKVLPSVGDIVQVDAEQSRAEGGWIAKHVLLQKEENVWDDLENDEFRYMMIIPYLLIKSILMHKASAAEKVDLRLLLGLVKPKT